MGVGSKSIWINSQLVTGLSDPRARDQHLKCEPFSGRQSSPCGVWVTSVDLVSEVSWLLNAQWVWGNSVLLAEIPHVWSQGQISNWLFSTICVYHEDQDPGTRHSEPLPSSWIFRIPGRITYLTFLWGDIFLCLIFSILFFCPSYFGIMVRLLLFEFKQTIFWTLDHLANK